MSSHQCHHCKATLSRTQYFRSHYCDNPLCQRTKIQKYLVENKKRLSQQLIADIEEFIEDSQLQKLPSKLLDEIKNISPVVALLPANTNQLRDANRERNQDFLDHVSRIYDDIENNNQTDNKIYTKSLNSPLPKKEAQLVGKACATCMGSCCNLGKTHAFLDYPSLKHILGLQTSILTKNELVTLYSEYFPDQSYEYSCVFLGKTGCTLPRDLRSFTCNNFLCDEITHYQIALSQADSAVTYAAAVYNDTILHSSVYDEDNFIRVVEK